MNEIILATTATVAALAYIDTVEIFLRSCPRGLRKKINDVQGAGPRIDPSGTQGHVWGYRISVHQPKNQTLHLLDEVIAKYHGTLCRFDVAFDFSGISARWLEQRCILRWRRPGPMHDEPNGVYWVSQTARRKRSNRDVALYADRPSKITGEIDCTHFELRFYGTESVRREGFDRPSQLIGLNPERQFRKHIKLVDFDDEAADRFKRRFIRRQVKRLARNDRGLPPRNRSQKERYFLDRYQASYARRVYFVYDKVIHSRVQRVKDINPKHVEKLKILSPQGLYLPRRLSWVP